MTLKSYNFKPYLLSALLGGAASAGAGEIQWNGFLSAIGGKTLNSETTYGTGFIGYAGGDYTDELSFTQETLAGLRGFSQINDKLAMTVQLVSRGGNAGKVEAEWAYLSYALSSNFSLELGKYRLPLYYFSNFLDVGYVYHWIRPPAAMYGGPSTLTGLSLRYQKTFGAYDLSVQGWYGNDLSTPDGSLDVGFTTSDNAGVNVELGRGPLTLRAVYNTTDFSLVLPPGIEVPTELVFTAFSVIYEQGPVKVVGEYTEIDPEAPFFEPNRDWYLSFAYRAGKFTPHVTYLENSNNALNGAPDTSEQIAGLRWDFNDNAAFKVEYSLREPEGIDQQIDVVTFGMDLIF